MRGVRTTVAILFLLATCSTTAAPTKTTTKTPTKATTKTPTKDMMNKTMTASGEFDVKMAPQPASDKGQEAALGRMSLDKQFRGDLVATSAGEMLMVRTPTDGSAGYVALERVTGKLAGRSGSFVLQHNGIMDRNTPSLTITVVPDSGTGELQGLKGSMTIDITGGKHFYRFQYELPR